MATIRKRDHKNGGVSYQAQVRVKGRPLVTATFKRKTDATRWAHDTESDIRHGRYFKTMEAQKHTVAEMIDRYINEVLPEKKDGTNQGHQLQWWKKQIGDYSLADVTPALILEYRDQLASGTSRLGGVRSPATVNRLLAAISVAFTVARKEWQWTESNPVLNVRKKKEPRGRTRILSDDERERLLDACKVSECELLYPIVVFALSTGARKGEILNLTWSDIDFNRGIAVFQDTKNDEVRSVPVQGHLLAELKRLSKVRRIDTNLVFPRPDGKAPAYLVKHWQTAIDAANIENFRFHDLRHTAASMLLANGVSLGQLAEILGHKTLQMVKRYSHLAVDHKIEAIAGLDQRMFGQA